MFQRGSKPLPQPRSSGGTVGTNSTRGSDGAVEDAAFDAADVPEILSRALGVASGIGKPQLLRAQEEWARKVVARRTTLTAANFNERRLLFFDLGGKSFETKPASGAQAAAAPFNNDGAAAGLSGIQGTRLQVEDLAPEAFRAVRRSFLYGFGDFAASLGTKPLVSVGGGGGRSGASFYMSHDEEFIVKYLPGIDRLIVMFSWYS
jgi:hypothetical protein